MNRVVIKFTNGRLYRPPRKDAIRLLRFWTLDAPFPPAQFNVDASVSALTGLTVPLCMDDNNALSCCVMAAQAKFLRRYHALECGSLLNISPAQVSQAYLAQTGGQDIGLIPDESFAFWASNGWAAGDDGAIHKIMGSARIDATDGLDVQRAIWKLGGVCVGGLIPEIWVNKTDPWELSDLSQPIAGGHEMYCNAYDAQADTYSVETWDRVQVIAGDAFRSAFSEGNQGECHGLIRGVDAIAAIDGLDTSALQTALQMDREAA